ncbi:hypothetical protein WA171_007339 [Blastocystis sp. BT1]
MQEEEFVELLNRFPVIRQTDYIADTWNLPLNRSLSHVATTVADSQAPSEETNVDQEFDGDYADFWSILRSYLEKHYSTSEVNEKHNQIYSKLKSTIQSYNLDDLDTLAQLIQ